jgi:hypothetical protein
MFKPAVQSFIIGSGVALAMSQAALAQFHAKKENGQTGVTPQAVQSAQRQASAASMPAGASAGTELGVPGGGISGGDMILPQSTREALSQHKVKLRQTQGKPIDIWGRAIHHSDGSFTESKQDLLTNTLEQVTKSKNGVKLQRRMIMLDDFGRPGEVLIYDGRDQFKYRGLQIYDTLGRFSEEQIYDAKGTLIRRKVQAYDPRGDELPLRSWDYVANVPADLRLVITEEDPRAPGSAPSSPDRNASQTSADTAAPPGEKKGLNLRGIFGSKKAK